MQAKIQSVYPTVVSNLEGRDSLSYALYHSSSLMPEYARKQSLWVRALPRVDVCVAQRIGNYLDAYLSSLRLGSLNRHHHTL